MQEPSKVSCASASLSPPDSHWRLSTVMLVLVLLMMTTVNIEGKWESLLATSDGTPLEPKLIILLVSKWCLLFHLSPLMPVSFLFAPNLWPSNLTALWLFEIYVCREMSYPLFVLILVHQVTIVPSYSPSYLLTLLLSVRVSIRETSFILFSLTDSSIVLIQIDSCTKTSCHLHPEQINQDPAT